MITSTGKRFMVVFADLDGDDMSTEEFATYDEAKECVGADQDDGANRKAIIIGVCPDGTLGTEDYT